MFTNNWNTWVRGFFIGKAVRTFKDWSGTTKDPTANNGYIEPGYLAPKILYSAMNTLVTKIANDMGTGVVFGTGDREPTADDYTISGNVVSGISATINRTYEDADDAVRITSVFTITNNNSSEVTIKEAALFAAITWYTTSVQNARMMIARMLLESPVTIPAGGVGQVTVSVDVNAPYVS